MSIQNDFFEAGSFAPIVSTNSRVLILGTMPGVESLKKQEYYGHPRNYFWIFLFEIFDREFTIDYDLRKALIMNNHLALWDTLEFCEREGSLDSKIKNEKPNNIKLLLEQYPQIHTIICNGKSAEKYFKKYQKEITLPVVGMPSTSPANASIPKEEKLKAWSRIKQYIGS